jgi:CRP-like cAMP-binding protein
LTDKGELRDYQKGEFIFHKGDPATEVYTILSGQVKVFGTVQDRDVTISVLEPADFFGEMALSGTHPRVVSAQAMTKTTLSIIDPAALKSLIAEPLVWQVIERMGNRISDVDQQLEKLRAKDQVRMENLSQLLEWRTRRGSELRPS